jgi:hypothetical protein
MTNDTKPGITSEKVELLRTHVQNVIDDVAGKLPSEASQRLKDVVSFRTSITEETDRGAVLMSAAYLDDKLKELIELRLVQDKKIIRRAFDFNGPLGSFSSRINFAYLLGLLPKNAMRDLHTIREIRNQFAHYAAPLSYDHEKVKLLCERLVFHGVKDAAEPGAKFRRSVMGLLTLITLAFEKVQHLAAEPDYEIPDRTDAYKTVAEIFTKLSDDEYPLKHHHE